MTLSEILAYFMVGFSIFIFFFWIISYISYKLNRKENDLFKEANNFQNRSMIRRTNTFSINQHNNNFIRTSANRNFANTESNFNIPVNNKYFIYHNKLSE
jgi:hypothetical protein